MSDAARIRKFFGASYADARARFAAACGRAGLRVRSFPARPRGPDGGALATDAALIGEHGARRLLIVLSGTHGVEGYAGSGAQVAWIARHAPGSLPRGVAVLMVHAINPYGFAWDMRTTEDGVDLNRNFRAPGGQTPANPEYARLDPHLVPETLTGAKRAAGDRAIRAYIAKHGLRAFQTALGRGQISHPDGLFYAGRRPTWSHRTHHALLRSYAARAKHVALVDLHTGLGPYGNGEPLSFHAPRGALARLARSWYGPSLTEPRAGASVSSDLDGTTYDGYERWLGRRAAPLIALEFGTYAFDRVVGALRAEAWLRRHGDLRSPVGRRVRRRLRDIFSPPRDDWRELVVFRTEQVIAQALRGLGRL